MINNTGRVILIICFTIFLLACSKQEPTTKKDVWGQIEGTDVYLYTLSNSNGITIKITNYGGIITSLIVPDKNGAFDDIVLGFDNLKQYLEPHPSFGAVIGRFANRIENATFNIDSTTYRLTKNIGDDILHGNNEFDCVIWDSQMISNAYGNGIKLHYLSKDGANGFPGNVHAYVSYTLSESNDLRITFEAKTDKKTHINMTQHSYFNLSPNHKTIYNHQVEINANQYIRYDKTVKPSRTIASLKNKTWDLSKLTKLGDSIHTIAPNGYNHCYVLNKPLNKLEQVAQVIEPYSGRTLKVSTTQPGIVFYTGNYLDSTLNGKYVNTYAQHAGLCLESQHYPDAPNNSNFPTTLLIPGETYKEVAIYTFGLLNE
ncbi:aldose epimerase family protein [Algibacter mikhailovii]|uniref:Aldose 1-epimerase n=1 Tax=Algibacter mikhailovii TaxID=425498 RepID=A0A918QYH2_9FLAO|nr:aldose epimerase family protein [Algibacter mikhailovii]GGZ74501.1 aldose 1-epimerase [Algibacter mikhailovii]